MPHAEPSQETDHLEQWVRDAVLSTSRLRVHLEEPEAKLVEEEEGEQQRVSLLQELERTHMQAPTREALQKTQLWQDLKEIETFAIAPLSGDLAAVRKAIHRLIRHLDPVQGLTTQIVQKEPPYPLSETTYAYGSSTPFLLALSAYRFPLAFQDTGLGKLIYLALYSMLNIDEVVIPIEAGQIANLGRQRIYEISRASPERLFPIYKQTNSEKGTMTSYYLLAHVQKLKKEKEKQYAHRRRPGPTRPFSSREKTERLGDEELLRILDTRIAQHAQNVQTQVRQLGGTCTIAGEPDALRKSPLGIRGLLLLEYLNNPMASSEEKAASREHLTQVLQAFYGMPRVPNAEDTSEFGEFVNSIRVKDTKMPEVLNISELLQYLAEHAGPRKYFLVDVYALRNAQRLWPVRANGRPRYFKQEVTALCEQLRQEQQEAREE